MTSFLSRLCGGEDQQYQEMLGICFLSRLCGGEVSSVSGLGRDFFLSRLCGGEVDSAGEALCPCVSKPPMWR